MASVRRLSAIMFTDMVGSTAAAQSNEENALKLRDEQAALVRPLFAAHQGREIKSMGDGFLAEFDSALRAVQCALDIQQHLHERNSQPGVASIQLRIGIHLGDVEQKETDIFGDAVNIASRIEPLASPGGVCISGEVYSQVRNKVPNKLEKLPPAPLKGLQISIDVYRVVLPWAAAETALGRAGSTGIAILPFSNISPDPKDEYFADGLTEELITVLSQLRDLRVISRTSVMQYKSTTKTASLIGVELGVVSILEGSVRKAGNRIRVTAQLIDAGSDRHLWAKTYDRELDDIFAVQTEIARQVAEALQVELRATDVARLGARGSVLPDSYLAYLKGRTRLHERSVTALTEAKEQFELAISLDPQNAAAYSGLADAIRLLGWRTHDVPRASWEETTRRLVAQAIELDPNLAEAHTSLGLIQWEAYDYAGAEKQYQLSLALNPSYSAAHHWYATLLEDEGRLDEALREGQLAESADPLAAGYVSFLANLLVDLKRFDEALLKIQRLGVLEPDSYLYHDALLQFHRGRSELAQCVAEGRRCEELQANPSWKRMWHVYNLALSGEKQAARAMLESEEASPGFPQLAWIVGWAYALIGDLDSCFRCLEVAVETHNIALQPFRTRSELENVRGDPRFQILLKKMNLA
ncbi:MAG TPA: adenylate/guanylate cyclase domain-containing protein [Thermoplasmata archaeon]|nr:adenylate/guanylate cyclase domain-containing protein [Thermoplasmata archaeon]